MEFDQIYKEIEEKMLKQFKENLKESMTRKEYVYLYLSSFLTPYLKISPEEIKDELFREISHKKIDSISLCQEEVEFFHLLNDMVMSDTFISEAIQKFNSIEGLIDCQLGAQMLQFLEESKNIILKE